MLILNRIPFVEGLVLNEYMNKRYEVVDIAWGANHSWFLVRGKQEYEQERRILACGYHNCLGDAEISEDTHHLQYVKIPELEDYDNIDFLIASFNSTAVIDNENSLYYWGDDFTGFSCKIPEK